MTIQETITPNFDAIKAKQNAAWASGDYAVVGTTLQIVGERLAESMDLVPGAKVLDVAAGNGNATLAFARRFHEVTSTDYVAALLDKGRARAVAEGHTVQFRVADAEDLPFEDGRFDAVVSTFGVMFAPNQARAARELARVVRSGGFIGLANWTPDSFIGQMLKVVGKHVTSPAGLMPPSRWGNETALSELFPEAKNIQITTENFVFRYKTPAHFVDLFRSLYGPVHKAFLALEPQGQVALEADLLELIDRFNTAEDGSVRIQSEYLEVIVQT